MFHITGYYFFDVVQLPPEGQPDASGFEYVPTAIYKCCGMVIHNAISEEEAIKIFWAEYRNMSEDIRPWINLHINGKPYGRQRLLKSRSFP